MNAQRMKIIIASMFATSFSVLTQAASFDCDKAATPIEKLICSDEKVSLLDDQLSVAYKTASETVADKNLLKVQQRDWLKNVRNMCTDLDCLAKNYQSKIDELNENASLVKLGSEKISHTAITKSSVETQKFQLTRGSQYSLCRHYVALMNRVSRNPEDTCELEYSFDKKAEQDGFKEIYWISLDPKENEKLLLDYWMYIAAQHRDIKNENTKERLRDRYFKEKIWLWRAIFDLNNDGKPDDVYKVVWRDCNLNNAYFFLPSEKGFASRNAGERIDLYGNVFIYQGRTFAAGLGMITEPFAGNGIFKTPEFVNPGPAVCSFKLIDLTQGK